MNHGETRRGEKKAISPVAALVERGLPKNPHLWRSALISGPA